MGPFLKWPGGKAWLAPFIARLVGGLPWQRYFEPFLGGGAVFFELSPTTAYLTDINDDLINTYKMVRASPSRLISMLKTLPVNKRTYQQLRDTAPNRRLERAARFLYLNRTAFGGMYRVNKAGKFNVPYGGGGRTPDILWSKALLHDASKALKAASLRAQDFAQTLAATGDGDLIYCDPTYTVTHNNNGFRKYNEPVFSWDDQVRLAKECVAAYKRGAIVLISNAWHEDVWKLYRGAPVITVSRFCCLAKNARHRIRVSESLIFLAPRSLIKAQRELSLRDFRG